jgi:hypothetical protein
VKVQTVSTRNPSYHTWNPKLFEAPGIFSTIYQELLYFKSFLDWPLLDDLNLFLKTHYPLVMGGMGITLKCVPQPSTRASVPDPFLPWESKELDFNYQLRIALKGEIHTRTRNWHDFFNFITWCLLPQTKATLNRAHFWEYEKRASFPWNKASFPKRSLAQDALTLLDEGGLLWVTSCPALYRSLKEGNWKECFLDQRNQLQTHFFGVVLGHALFEDVLKGKQTVHASSLGLLVDPSFFSLSETQQKGWLDSQFSQELDRLKETLCPQMLSPMPLFGLPQFRQSPWDSSEILNTNYYRESRNSFKI